MVCISYIVHIERLTHVIISICKLYTLNTLQYSTTKSKFAATNVVTRLSR